MSSATRRQAETSAPGTTSTLLHEYFGHGDRPLAINRIAECNAAGTPTLLREYHWLGGQPVAVIEGGVIHSVRADNINRPVFATNAAGTKTWTVSYLPFGGIHASTGSPVSLRFPGQWYEAESLLHQNWMRDYDPTTGRYLQADPLGLVDGASVYGYAKGSPLRNTDPRGEDCVAVGNSVTCTPSGGPTVTFPRPLGWPDSIGPQDSRYHAYDVVVPLDGVDWECVLRALADNPTPGSPAPATYGGTLNNATPTTIQTLADLVDTISSFGNDPGGYNNSPVNSYVRNGGSAVVNVTLPGHPLFPGYVVRTVIGQNVNNFGEGTAFLQGPLMQGLGVAGFLSGVWDEETQRMIDQCRC